MIKYRIVRYEELNELTRNAVNPPLIKCEEDEETFRNEYWDSHDVIRTSLEQLGIHNYYGDGDFLTNQDWELSRGITVQITSMKMMSEHVITTIVAALQRLPERYKVALDHSIIGMPYMFLVISEDEVVGWGEDISLLRRLGFP